MTVYIGSTFKTCALRAWGIWVSMRDFHAATLRHNWDLGPDFSRIILGANQCHPRISGSQFKNSEFPFLVKRSH